MSARALTDDQLAALEGWWVSEGATLASRLNPGLSPQEIDERVSPFPDLAVPAEVKTWWGWHNGVAAEPHEESIFFGDGRDFLPLEEVLAYYEPDHQETGEIHLLRLVAGEPQIYVECHPDRPETARVFTQVFTEDLQLAAESLGELVGYWLRLIECGAWWVDPNGQADVIREKIPADLANLGIA